MASRNFEPPLAGSAIVLKDLENAAAVAKEFGVRLPMAHAASDLFRLLKAQGKGDSDPSVLVELD